MILMIIRYDMNKLTQFIPLLFEFDKHLFVFISFSRNLLALTPSCDIEKLPLPLLLFGVGVRSHIKHLSKL